MKLKARESLTELENGIGKLIEMKPLDAVSVELRDHVLDIY